MGNGFTCTSRFGQAVAPSCERQIGDGDGAKKGRQRGPLPAAKSSTKVDKNSESIVVSNPGATMDDGTGPAKSGKAEKSEDNTSDEPDDWRAKSLLKPSLHSSEKNEETRKRRKYRNREEIAHKLSMLEESLKKGDLPSIEDMIVTLKQVSRVLHRSKSFIRVQESEERLENVSNIELRGWLENTFTNSQAMSEPCYRSNNGVTRFKAAANSIIISNFIKTFASGHSLDMMPVPPEAKQYLQDFINSWSFNIFKFKILYNRSPLKMIAYHLFMQHGLLLKYHIPLTAFNNYMTRVEEYYDCHNNPYHNSMHGADVAQSLNSLITNTGVIDLMTDVEKLASILAALIHDVDHPGQNNQFLVNQGTELARLYHDKSVLENHHLKVTFDLFHSDNSTNFLVNATKDDYRDFRSLVIDMVIATDMAHHFKMVKNVAAILANHEEGGMQLFDKERHTVFQCLLHMVDISHPGKPWSIHYDWSMKISEEFCLQGDMERELSMPISPLCDRSNQNLPNSQIGFANFIVAPLFAVVGDMIDLLLTTAAEKKLIEKVGACERVWDTFLQENMAQWKEEQAKEKSFPD